MKYICLSTAYDNVSQNKPLVDRDIDDEKLAMLTLGLTLGQNEQNPQMNFTWDYAYESISHQFQTPLQQKSGLFPAVLDKCQSVG